MNITELDMLCKKYARVVFEAAKDSLLNPPFIEVKDRKGLIEDIIDFEIKQSFGSKVLKKYLNSNSLSNDLFIKMISEKIRYYEEIIISTFLSFSRKI